LLPGQPASMRADRPHCFSFPVRSTDIPISSATLFRGSRPCAPPWERSELPTPSAERACTWGRRPLAESSKKKESLIQEMMKIPQAVWSLPGSRITSGMLILRWYRLLPDSGRHGLRFRFPSSGHSAGGWESCWITAPGVFWEPLFSKKIPPPLQCNRF